MSIHVPAMKLSPAAPRTLSKYCISVIRKFCNYWRAPQVHGGGWIGISFRSRSKHMTLNYTHNTSQIQERTRDHIKQNSNRDRDG